MLAPFSSILVGISNQINLTLVLSCLSFSLVLFSVCFVFVVVFLGCFYVCLFVLFCFLFVFCFLGRRVGVCLLFLTGECLNNFVFA